MGQQTLKSEWLNAAKVYFLLMQSSLPFGAILQAKFILLAFSSYTLFSLWFRHLNITTVIKAEKEKLEGRTDLFTGSA